MEAAYSTLENISPTHLLKVQEGCQFGDPEKERAWQQVHGLIKATLSHRWTLWQFYSVVLEESELWGVIARPKNRITIQSSRVLQQRCFIHLGPGRNRTPGHGTSNDHPVRVTHFDPSHKYGQAQKQSIVRWMWDIKDEA